MTTSATETLLEQAQRSPHTGNEISGVLEVVHQRSVRFWNAFNTQAFLSPIGDAWSPSDNVRHLTKTMRAVTLGLRLPRVPLWLDAMRAPCASRSYDEMRVAYVDALTPGVTAGPFTPSTQAPPSDPDAERTRIMAFHAIAVDGLRSRLARWPESALDRRRLPHPLMGSITVREMMLFVLYHNQHHVETVRRRVAELPASGSRSTGRRS